MRSGSWGFSSAGRGAFGATPTIETRPTRSAGSVSEQSKSATTQTTGAKAVIVSQAPVERHNQTKRPERQEMTRLEQELEEPRQAVAESDFSPVLLQISGSAPDTELEESKKQPLHRVTIKALVVVAEKDFQKVGTLDIPAPVGVGLNVATGELTRPVRLEPIGHPVLKPVVLEGKLVNEGFVRARLIVEDIDPNPCPDVRKVITKEVVIPFQSIHDIDCVRPGDHVQEFAEIEALLVSGLPAQLGSESGCAVNLRLKAILKAKVVITQECILSVPAEVLHCLPCPG